MTPERAKLLKPGDKVECIDAYCGPYLKLGEICTVEEITPNGGIVVENIYHPPARFEKVEHSSITQYIGEQSELKQFLKGIDDVHDNFELLNNNKEITMLPQLRTKANELYKYVKPYERYIIILGVVIVIDHFILGGKLKDRLTNLAKTIGNKLVDKLQGLTDRIDDL